MATTPSQRIGGRLIVVATPIGNLGDLSPRAADALRDSDLVLAEDTRHTGRLLAHIDARTPQRSLHEHNEDERSAEIVAAISGGSVIALVSDAGTPAVSDPGYRLVRACVAAGLVIEAVPGPSAVLHALVVSGLPTDRFVFEGFLPRKGAARRERLNDVAEERRTCVLYISPHRAAADLRDLADACGADRPAALCRELTKLHEEALRGTLGGLADLVAEDGVRGELTLVVGGLVVADTVPETGDLVDEVHRRVAAGDRMKAAASEVARENGVRSRDLYQAVLDAGSSAREGAGT